MSVSIHMPRRTLDALHAHLFPPGGVCEEAAFLFATVEGPPDSPRLVVLEATLISPDGFASRSRFYLELTDQTRAAVIKRAHDLGAGLIECHSHPGQRGACFSWSDLHGGTSTEAVRVNEIQADRDRIQPTGLTLENWSSIYERPPL